MDIYSDIHLEFFENGEFPKYLRTNPILILAGDIGNTRNESLTNFLRYCSLRFRKPRILCIANNGRS